jgi:hypothetical protein
LVLLQKFSSACTCFEKAWLSSGPSNATSHPWRGLQLRSISGLDFNDRTIAQSDACPCVRIVIQAVRCRQNESTAHQHPLPSSARYCDCGFDDRFKCFLVHSDKGPVNGRALNNNRADRRQAQKLRTVSSVNSTVTCASMTTMISRNFSSTPRIQASKVWGSRFQMRGPHHRWAVSGGNTRPPDHARDWPDKRTNNTNESHEKENRSKQSTFGPRQHNLRVDSGSGSLPRL